MSGPTDYPVADEVQGVIHSKPWWQSRSIWGGIVAAVVPLLALFGYQIDQGTALEIVMIVVTALGGVLAIVGRVKAQRPITPKILPKNNE